MKGINEWAKDLKHNESVAKQFEGVKSVSDIVAVARKNGYEFTPGELIDFDLDSVSGGAGGELLEGAGSLGVDVKATIDVVVQNATVATTSTGDNSTTQSNPSISMSNTKNR